MKNIIPAFLLLVAVAFSKQGNAQVDQRYDSIKQLNLDHYASLPIDSLLKVIPQSFSNIDIIGSLKSNKAMGLNIYYPGGLNILIKPKNYVFMTINDPNRIWNLNLLKKETASYINVMHPDFTSLYGQYP